MLGPLPSLRGAGAARGPPRALSWFGRARRLLAHVEPHACARSTFELRRWTELAKVLPEWVGSPESELSDLGRGRAGSPVPGEGGDIDVLRRRPEFLVLPGLVIGLVANLLPVFYWDGEQRSGAQLFFLMHIAAPDPMLPVTAGLGVALFLAVVLWVDHLSWFRKLIVALAFPWAYAMTYEWGFALAKYLNAPWPDPWPVLNYLLLAFGSVSLAGYSTWPYWRPNWKAGATGLVVTLSFVVWLLIGFPQWTQGSFVGFSLNVVTKAGTALFFLQMLRFWRRTWHVTSL